MPAALRRLRARWALCLLGAALLPGCGGAPQDDATPSAAPIAVAPADAAPAAAASAQDVDSLIARANAALADNRLFAPAGDNTLELLLQVRAQDPSNPRATGGLVDILPFVLVGLEQRMAAGELDEAARLLALFEQADPAHPALARLARQLAAEREAAQARTAQAEEAAARAAIAAVAVPPASADTPRAPVARPLASASPAPAPAEAATAATAAAPPAAPVTAPAAAASSVGSRTPAPPAASAAAADGALPAPVSRVNPRYPPRAQQRRIEGQVDVQFVVGPDGRVAEVQVVRATPEGVFDREAVAAMQRWRFEASGRTSRGRQTFDFKLDGR